MDVDARRAQLQAWTAQSRRNRGRIIRWCAIGTVVGAVVLAIVGGPVGAVALMTPIAFGLCGTWITTAHLLTFRGQLRDLDGPPAPGRKIVVKQGRGRQYRR